MNTQQPISRILKHSGTNNTPNVANSVDEGIHFMKLKHDGTWQTDISSQTLQYRQAAYDAGIMAPLADTWSSGIINAQWTLQRVKDHATIHSLLSLVNHLCDLIDYQSIKPCWIFRNPYIPEVSTYGIIYEFNILNAGSYHVRELMLNICSGAISLNPTMSSHWRNIVGFRLEMVNHDLHVRIRLWITKRASCDAFRIYLRDTYDQISTICNDLHDKNRSMIQGCKRGEKKMKKKVLD